MVAQHASTGPSPQSCPAVCQRALFYLGPSPCAIRLGDCSGEKQGSPWPPARAMHPAAASPTPSTHPPSDKFIPVYRDFLLRQLHLLSFHPAASLNKAGGGCSLNTFPGQSTDKPSPGLEHLSAGLSHATVNSSSSDDEDMPMADASSDGSSDEGFHEDMQRSWPPFGAEEFYRLMNTNQITGILLSPFPILLVYDLF